MAEDARRVADLHLTVEQVQVRAAHGACLHAQEQLTWARLGDRPLHRAQRPSDLLEDHRSHGSRRRRLRHSSRQ
jgi:hypothetical protein